MKTFVISNMLLIILTPAGEMNLLSMLKKDTLALYLFTMVLDYAM